MNFRWIISERGYANIIKSEADEVHGVVYRINEEDEASLDKAVGIYIGKKPVALRWKRPAIHALYILILLKQKAAPKDEYAIRISRGVSDASLPYVI